MKIEGGRKRGRKEGQEQSAFELGEVDEGDSQLTILHLDKSLLLLLDVVIRDKGSVDLRKESRKEEVEAISFRDCRRTNSGRTEGVQ